MRIENDAQERAEIRRIYAKLSRGEKLTPVEERIKAYSEYGTAAPCGARLYASSPRVRIPDYPPES